MLRAVLILLGPRVFAPLGRLAEREHDAGQPLSPTVLAAALMLCTLSAWFSDVHRSARGVRRFPDRHRHAARGFRAALQQLLEPFTLVFLLPVFFTYSGLNTQLTMVNTPQLLVIARGDAGGVHLRQVHRLLGGGARWPARTIAALSESARS